MKRITIVLVLLIVSSVAFSQGISFQEGSWEEVKQKAKSENKYIFVDGFTTWCGPCKWMAKNVFPNDTAGQFYNANFINYELDMEKGEGIEFAKKYDVHSYPTYLYFNPNGELAHVSGGSKPMAWFIEDGKNALNPEKQLFTLKKKYDGGERSPEFLYQYTKALVLGAMPYENVANEYINTQKEEDLANKKNIEFILYYVNDINSRGFQFLLSHKDKFIAEKGEEVTNRKITSAAMESVRHAAKNKDEAQLKQILELLKGNDNLIAEANMKYYQITKDWEKYADAAAVYVEKYAMSDWNELNSIAWTFYENVDNKTMLEKAEVWAKKSVDLDKNYYNTDTYAHVLFKLGRYEEAKEWAGTAIKLAKEGKENSDETEKLLDEIKTKKPD